MPLDGFAARINEAARFLGLERAPGRELTADAYGAEEPNSLLGLMTLRETVQAIRDLGEGIKPIEKLYNLVVNYYSLHPLVLAPGSIIPALRSPDPEDLKRMRQALQPDGNRHEFSTRLMAGIIHDTSAAKLFYGRLEDGYRSAHKEPGWYKLTDRAATKLHQRLSEEADGKVGVLPLDEFAPISAVAGPRKGQVSKGLREPWGNLMP